MVVVFKNNFSKSTRCSYFIYSLFESNKLHIGSDVNLLPNLMYSAQHRASIKVPENQLAPIQSNTLIIQFWLISDNIYLLTATTTVCCCLSYSILLVEHHYAINPNKSHLQKHNKAHKTKRCFYIVFEAFHISLNNNNNSFNSLKNSIYHICTRMHFSFQWIK